MNKLSDEVKTKTSSNEKWIRPLYGKDNSTSRVKHGKAKAKAQHPFKKVVSQMTKSQLWNTEDDQSLSKHKDNMVKQHMQSP